MLTFSLGHELTRHGPGRRDATQQSGRHDVRPVFGKLGDDRGIEVQQFGNHIRGLCASQSDSETSWNRSARNTSM